jgi:hypothetical protein
VHRRVDSRERRGIEWIKIYIHIYRYLIDIKYIPRHSSSRADHGIRGPQNGRKGNASDVGRAKRCARDGKLGREIGGKGKIYRLSYLGMLLYCYTSIL